MAETLWEDEDMKAIECGQRPQRTRLCCILIVNKHIPQALLHIVS